MILRLNSSVNLRTFINDAPGDRTVKVRAARWNFFHYFETFLDQMIKYLIEKITVSSSPS